MKKILVVALILLILFFIIKKESVTEKNNEKELNEFLKDEVNGEIKKEMEEIYLESPLFLRVFPDGLNSKEIQQYIDEIHKINETLNRLPPLLRDDFLNLILKLDLNSEKSLPELMKTEAKIEKEVDDFLKIYILLPSGIRTGIEDSKSIEGINSIPEFTGIIIDLLITYQNLPPEIKEIIPEFRWIKDGFEIEEIKEFNNEISLNFNNNVFKEWFVKNFYFYDVSNLKKSWDDFLKLQKNDEKPPIIKFDVRTDDDIFFENESPDTVVEISLEDDLNSIKRVEITIGGETKTLKSKNSLYFHAILRFKLKFGKYTVKVEAMDNMGNMSSEEKEYEYYPDVYTLNFIKLYDEDKIEEAWEKAREYRPIQPYPKENLGFEVYGAYILGEKMREYYEEIKNNITERDPVYIAKAVNTIINRGYLVQVNFPEIIKKIPLKSGICGYDAEIQVIILNNLYRDLGIRASAFLIPASKSGTVVDHSEVFLHTEDGNYIMGSNYEGIYKMGEDPYSKDPDLVLMGEKEWFKLKGAKDAFLQAFSSIILPYRPDKVAIEKFYDPLNFDVVPIYPYIDIRNEMLKSHYVIYPSYVNFILPEEYVFQFMDYVEKNGIDERVWMEVNKLESARRYWYWKKGYELYEGKNPEAYIMLVPTSYFNSTFVYINTRTPEAKIFVQELKMGDEKAYEEILSII